MGYFIKSINNEYYEGDKQSIEDIQVSYRPSPHHTYNFTDAVWIAPDPIVIAENEAIAYFTFTQKHRQFIFTLFYILDQRLRILEAKPAITRLQFLTGIKQLYKDS